MVPAMRRLSSRPAISALAVGLSTVLLAGCFSVQATFDIHDDGTADLDFVTLIDSKQIEQFAGMLGEDAGVLDGMSGDELLKEMTGGEDPCADFVSSFADYDVTSREINEDGQIGVGCTAKDVPLADLTDLGDSTSTFTIEQDDTGTRFSAELQGVDELAGDPAETEQMTAMLGKTLDELFTIKFTVSAPGTLGENNATSTDGSTATWDIKPDADFVTNGDAAMTAAWTPGGGSGGGSSSLLIILVVIAVIAAVIAAIVLSKRKKGSPPAGTPSTEPAMAGAPTAMPPTAAPPLTSPPPPPGATAPPAPPVAPPPPPPPASPDLQPPPPPPA